MLETTMMCFLPQLFRPLEQPGQNGWDVISCCRDGAMRAIDEIHTEILARVNAFFAQE